MEGRPWILGPREQRHRGDSWQAAEWKKPDKQMCMLSSAEDM